MPRPTAATITRRPLRASYDADSDLLTVCEYGTVPQPALASHTAADEGAPRTAETLTQLSGELGEAIEAGGGPDGPLHPRGIHLHVGSQLGAVDAWRSAFRVGLRLLELQRATLTDFDTLDAAETRESDPGQGYLADRDRRTVPRRVGRGLDG